MENMLFNLILRGTRLMAAEGGGGDGSGGGTAADAGQQTGGENAQGAQPDAAAERMARYEKVKEEFGDLIEADGKAIAQKAFNQRFKEMKQLQEANSRDNAFKEKVAARYGVDPRDTNALIQAIDNDEAFLRDRADREGYTIPQMREKIEGEAAKRELNDIKMQQLKAEALQKIEAEEARVKEVYPTFDLEKEAGNPYFTDLLRSKVPMKTAFEVIHMDELMRGAMQYTAAKVQQTTARNIQARQARPDEGAAAKATPATTKVDVHKMTKAEREEYAKRVMRGEKISFS